MRKLLAVLLVVMMLGLTACASEGGSNTQSEVITIRYTHYQPGTLDQPKQAAAEAFKGFVETKSNGQIVVEIYPNSELGDAGPVLEGLKVNSIQMTVVHDGPLSAIYAPIGVFNIPFLFNGQSEAWTIFDSSYVKNMGEDMANTIGIRMLGMADNGIRHFTNSKRPINRLADMAGLTIRVQPSPLYQTLVESLGANPTAIAWAELPTALQQGLADGQENGVTNILAAKLYETQKYVTLNAHVYSFHAYMISEEFWKGLSASQRQIVQEGVDIAKWVHRGMTANQDLNAKAILSSVGMEVSELTASQVQEFRAAAQPAVVDWMKTNIPAKWIDDLLNEINALRN